MPDPRLAEVDARLKRGDLAGARAIADALVRTASLPSPERALALLLRSRAHERPGPAVAVGVTVALVAVALVGGIVGALHEPLAAGVVATAAGVKNCSAVR